MSDTCSYRLSAPGDLSEHRAATAKKPTPSLERLHDFVRGAGRLTVITGAGCSTAAGIPAYRDSSGTWMAGQPLMYESFIASRKARERYWARSLIGYARIASASPTATHRVLAELEGSGAIHELITQNVDGLHRRAGSRRLIELHGRLDRVHCLECGHGLHRDAVQEALLVLNPHSAGRQARAAPDGDAELEQAGAPFRVAACERCGGVLKPDVVFFGESVPKNRSRRALAAVRASDAVLVLGSSLAVLSGFRLVREAARLGRPIAAVNIGRTRADELFDLKLEIACDEAMSALAGGARG